MWSRSSRTSTTAGFFWYVPSNSSLRAPPGLPAPTCAPYFPRLLLPPASRSRPDRACNTGVRRTIDEYLMQVAPLLAEESPRLIGE